MSFIISKYWSQLQVFHADDFGKFKEDRLVPDVLLVDAGRCIVIHRTVGKERSVFCQARSGWILGLGLTRVVMTFHPDAKDLRQFFDVVIFVNNYGTFADTVYNGIKYRWCGLSPINATHGSRDFKLVVLQDQEQCLVSNNPYTHNPDMVKTKGFFTGRSPQNPGHPLNSDTPLAHYHDFYSRDSAFDFSFIRKDSLFEVESDSEIDTLVFLSMALVLKLHEQNRPQKIDPMVTRNNVPQPSYFHQMVQMVKHYGCFKP